ncbi:hypothetical protein AAG570_003739 [Ranatra chinensis]|uniref:DNA-directed RNA polymerase n=1 Tax=Ranatra chinensis TaxID=642074 RepID=A0ABD0Y5N9_9HEMI
MHRDLSSLKVMHKNMNYRHKQVNVYPYLMVLNKRDYKDLIMHEIRKLAEGSETFSPTVGQLYKDLGNQVRLRYEMKVKSDAGVLDKIEQIYTEYCKWYLNPTGKDSNNCRQKWQQLSHQNQNGPSLDLKCYVWPQTILFGIGKFLYNIIMRDIKIDVNIFRTGQKEAHYLPAFYSVFRHQGHIMKEEVKPHPLLSRLFRAAAIQKLSFSVVEVPMVVPTVPWTSLNTGGYIAAKTNLIRLPHQAVQQWERLNQSPISQIYPSFDSLNQLGSVPWKVNKPVLDTVIELFNKGGCSKLDIPEPPSACPILDPITPDMTKVERFQAYRQRMIMKRRKAEMYSLWCDALYRLSLANHFRDRIFWLPHNMDFRGRVYPCPPHLNHLGSDMARSLLAFAKAEPLGPDGLKWLKIHLINLTGLKKRDAIEDRLKFADEIIPDILDSANDPLGGRRWWMESEEPWQTLACCLEIRDAMAHPGGPETFPCHFPVHQDGSCNGLQHYAALGRDSAGAASVNLIAAPVPQDVYSCVAAIVERERNKDANDGVKVAQVLEGFVRRKVIKQTVMTTVYGVTRFGARLQIAKQLKDIENFPKDFVWPASTYLVAKTFASLREMFTSTREIQDWFTESARMISQVCGQNVEYITPLGLPVVQPYYRYKSSDNKKTAPGNVNEHYLMDMYERPNVMKQKNAFPPNFIHSLDSTHMMLTSIHSEQAGITFVSVHDCYWTHPSSIHIMNRVNYFCIIKTDRAYRNPPCCTKEPPRIISKDNSFNSWYQKSECRTDYHYVHEKLRISNLPS